MKDLINELQLLTLVIFGLFILLVICQGCENQAVNEKLKKQTERIDILYEKHTNLYFKDGVSGQRSKPFTAY